MSRKVFAVIDVDDDMAIAENMGTGEYLEREFGWLDNSGIYLVDWFVSDHDDVERWARYIDYLVEWAFNHSGDDGCYSSPVCYEEWCNKYDLQ